MPIHQNSDAYDQQVSIASNMNELGVSVFHPPKQCPHAYIQNACQYMHCYIKTRMTRVFRGASLLMSDLSPPKWLVS